jgi:flagellar hook-associated protein 3 FlgL
MFNVVAMCDHGRNTPKGLTGPESSWMNSDGKTLANVAYNTVNSAQTKIASRQSVYKDCQDMLTTQNQQVLGDITEVHSTDVSKLAVDMMTLQTVYNLSLNVGARILPQTLTDYLH